MLIFLSQENVNTCKEKDTDLKQMSQKAASKAFLWLSESLMKSDLSPHEAVNLTLCTRELHDTALPKVSYCPYGFYINF